MTGTMITLTADIIHITIILTAIDLQENITTAHVMEATGEEITVTELRMETMDVHPQEATAVLEMERAAMTEATATALHMAAQDTEVAVMEEAGIIEEAIMEEMITTTMGIPLANAIVILVHALARKGQDAQGADHVLTMTPRTNSSGWHISFGKKLLRLLMQGHILQFGYLVMMC